MKSIRISKTSLAALGLVAALVLGAPGGASAAAVDVSFTTSGAAGNWQYDFTFTNNVGGANEIYFLGVALPATDIVGTPGLWESLPEFTPWSNEPFGGSATSYTNVWCANDCDAPLTGAILPGQSLGGFRVRDTSAVAQTSIAWFAFAHAGTYDGPDCFICGANPGFEGLASPAAVPEPAAWALMIGGFGLAGATLRRRRLALSA